MKLASFLSVALVAVACQGSVEGSARTGGEVADFDKPLDSRLTAQSTGATDSQGIALLGARQDLSFKGPATTTCKCLAVATGQPGDGAFKWSGARPQISSDSQLVLALSSSGIDCPEAGASAPGASYWGYELSGNDVVVVVETASPSHPLASGAIIPRPGSGGQVYVRPLEKALPYGKASSGGDRCRVGKVVNFDSPPLAPVSETTIAPAEPSAPPMKTIRK